MIISEREQSCTSGRAMRSVTTPKRENSWSRQPWSRQPRVHFTSKHTLLGTMALRIVGVTSRQQTVSHIATPHITMHDVPHPRSRQNNSERPCLAYERHCKIKCFPVAALFFWLQGAHKFLEPVPSPITTTVPPITISADMGQSTACMLAN